LGDNTSLAYQQIHIGDKFLWKGQDRGRDYEQIFADQDLRGKYVLDIGSNLGYFSLRSAYEGAAQVVGIDISEVLVRKAREFAKNLDMCNVHFFSADIIKDFPCGVRGMKFDYVLCLNVLHHLRDISCVKRVLRVLQSFISGSGEMWFSVVIPKDKRLWSKKSIPKKRLAIAPKFFKHYWPNFYCSVMPSLSRKSRRLIQIQVT